MRHRYGHRKLGRNSSHRQATLANLASSLIEHERITTTVVKCKELRSYVEPLVTLAKRGDLHARRQAIAKLHKPTIVKKLFDEIGPQFSDRPGGYTRILKLGRRRGDNASMALIEFVS